MALATRAWRLGGVLPVKVIGGPYHLSVVVQLTRLKQAIYRNLLRADSPSGLLRYLPTVNFPIVLLARATPHCHI